MASRKKRSASVIYQPRRMTLTRNNRIHVLGMSLSQLNISKTYKTRIKAVLANNKALAHALGLAHQEIAALKKEIFQLKKEQADPLSNALVPRELNLVKSKLNGVCQHMDGMVKLLGEALSICKSQEDESQSFSTSNSEAACHLPSRVSFFEQNVAQLGIREERWRNDMTIIEEQEVTETQNLPPILFSDDASTKQYKKVPSRSRSRSLSRPEVYIKEQNHRENDFNFENPDRSVLQSCSDVGPRPSTSSNKGSMSSGVSSTFQRGRSSEDRNKSFDNDFAVQLDPQILSCAVQGCSSTAVQEQDICTGRPIEELSNQKESLASAGSGTKLVQDDYKMPDNVATGTLMDSELRTPVSRSAVASIHSDGTQLKDLSFSTGVASEERQKNPQAKELCQKDLESFHEQADSGDPDFRPKMNKRKSSRKAKKAEKSTPKSGKRKSKTVAAKTSKKKSKICQYPSDDLSTKASAIGPRQSQNKSPSATMEDNKLAVNPEMSNALEIEKYQPKADLDDQRKSVYGQQHALESKPSSLQKGEPKTGDRHLKKTSTNPEVVESKTRIEKTNAHRQRLSVEEPLIHVIKQYKPLVDTNFSFERLRNLMTNSEDTGSSSVPGIDKCPDGFEDQRESIPLKASESKEIEENNLGKSTPPDRSSAILKNNINHPDQIGAASGSTHSTTLSQMGSTNSLPSKKSKSSIAKLTNPINRRLWGKSSTGKENQETITPGPSPVSNLEDQRPSRRQRNQPVSYKEVSMKKKMRRE